MAYNKKGTEITMDVVQNFGAVGEKLQLNLISWNGADPKYDLRNWYTDKEGNEKFAKGITMTEDEVKELRDLLNSIDLD